MQFKEESAYRKFRDQIYNNRDKIIVVAENWGKSGIYGSFISDVLSKKQVLLLDKLMIDNKILNDMLVKK